MPELRKDPIVDRTVIIAEERAERPNEFAEFLAQAAGGGSHGAGRCPFCVGHETETPPAVYEQLGKDGNWTLRVVPNRYPIVTTEDVWPGHLTRGRSGDPKTPTPNPSPEGGGGGLRMSPDSEDVGGGLQIRPDDNQRGPAMQASTGAHEVIIESASHVTRIGELTPQQFVDVLRAWRDRIAHWRRDGRYVCPLLFKNSGSASGASLAHLHSQLVALPRVPRAIRQELNAVVNHYDRYNACIFCDLIANERTEGGRMVFDEHGFVAFTAYAGRQAYETWLLPSQHAADFDALADDELVRLAGMLRRILARIEIIGQSLAYNMILHTSPFDRIAGDRYHWHFELVPRDAQFAGFELGSKEFINSVAPERAAATLRKVVD